CSFDASAHTAPSSLHLSFFYAARLHPRLLSFPTRRSSDLSASHRSKQGESSDSPIWETRIRFNRDNDLRSLDWHHWLTCVIPKLDRKSTRLNSSHGSISYAVFCLKKKTIFKLP